VGRAGGRSINPTSTTLALIGVAQFSISLLTTWTR
jgi:hypothetical protein